MTLVTVIDLSSNSSFISLALSCLNKSLIFQIKLLVLKWRNPFTNFLTKVFLPNLTPVTGLINVGSFDLAYVAVKKIFIFFKYCSKELNPSKTVAFMWSVLCFWQYFIHCLICTSCFYSLLFLQDSILQCSPGSLDW